MQVYKTRQRRDSDDLVFNIFKVIDKIYLYLKSNMNNRVYGHIKQALITLLDIWIRNPCCVKYKERIKYKFPEVPYIFSKLSLSSFLFYVVEIKKSSMENKMQNKFELVLH